MPVNNVYSRILEFVRFLKEFVSLLKELVLELKELIFVVALLLLMLWSVWAYFDKLSH